RHDIRGHVQLIVRRRRAPGATLVPYTTLFRSQQRLWPDGLDRVERAELRPVPPADQHRRHPQRHRLAWRRPGVEHRRRWNRSKRSEEHTSELQSLAYLVCRLLLENNNEERVVD